mgnify:CR=1 FL=1
MRGIKKVEDTVSLLDGYNKNFIIIKDNDDNIENEIKISNPIVEYQCIATILKDGEKVSEEVVEESVETENEDDKTEGGEE